MATSRISGPLCASSLVCIYKSTGLLWGDLNISITRDSFSRNITDVHCFWSHKDFLSDDGSSLTCRSSWPPWGTIDINPTTALIIILFDFAQILLFTSHDFQIPDVFHSVRCREGVLAHLVPAHRLATVQLTLEQQFRGRRRPGPRSTRPSRTRSLLLSTCTSSRHTTN